MKVNLINKTDAITVLNRMLPENNWEDLIDDHLDISCAEGMEFLIREEVIDFVVNNYKGRRDPEDTWIFCEGVIAGIYAEADRQWCAEIEQLIEEVSSPSEPKQTHKAEPTKHQGD